MRILVADDEPEMTRVLEALLTREHFSVVVVQDGQDALHYGLAQNYDCLVLDIMMPKMDGIEVLRALRVENVSTPVLLLTAKSQVEDRIAGLDSGADDYLPKPFHNGEFLARVRALTRRGQAYTPSVLTCGNIALDCSTFELRCGASALRPAGAHRRPAPLRRGAERQDAGGKRIGKDLIVCVFSSSTDRGAASGAAWPPS